MSSPLNILVLFNDDHGQWALPAYGNKELKTPNIDYLAGNGVVLENAFTPIPVCSPARASFFTGLLPSQHGVHDYIAAAKQFHDTDWLAGLNTLPKLLSGANYCCGLSGKWHLGRDEYIQNGFDDWFALSGDYPIEHKGNYRYSDNGKIISQSGYKTHYITDRTVEFLCKQTCSQPFFHFTSFYATHSPWHGQPERLVRQYRECEFSDIPDATRTFNGQILNIEKSDVTPESIQEARAEYYASISAIDEAVGRILDELETNGLLDNTLIIYTSDHGLCLGHHGIWGKGNATTPQNMIEESIRVPMILSSPGLRHGTRKSEFVDHLDLFKTILDVANVSAPTYKFAGSSLMPLLSGTRTDWRKTQFGEYGPVRMIRTEQYKYIRRYDNGSNELFDLSSATNEGDNIIDRGDTSDIAQALDAQLSAHFENLDCPAPNMEAYLNNERFNLAEAWR